jgi:hypothetical protein
MIEKLRYRGDATTHFQHGQDYLVEFYITQQKCTVKLPGNVEKSYQSLAKFLKDWRMPSLKPEPSKIAPYDIFAQAESFESSFKILQKNSQTNNDLTLTFSIIVNKAFAAELYLKCVLVLNSKNIPALHNLEELFLLLDTQTQQQIISLYNAELPNYKDELESLSRMLMAYNGSSISTDFLSTLATAQSLFQRYRYAFEYDTSKDILNPTVNAITDALRKYIYSKHPEWNTGFPPIISSSAFGKHPNGYNVNAFNESSIPKNSQRFIAYDSCERSACQEPITLVFDMIADLPPPLQQTNEPRMVLFPKNGRVWCTKCLSHTNYNALKLTIEAYAGRKVYFPPSVTT